MITAHEPVEALSVPLPGPASIPAVRKAVHHQASAAAARISAITPGWLRAP